METFSDVNTAENMENYVRENFNSAQVASEINNRESAIYIASLENEIISYMKLNIGNAHIEKQKDNNLEIHRISVLQSFDGKKMGQLLLDEAIKIAQQMAVNSFWLGIWEQNQRALHFYSKNGFVEFDKHIFTLGNDLQTDLLMRLQMNK